MKKLILLFCIVFIYTSCGRPTIEGLPQSWYIHNSTNQTLILKCPFTETLFMGDAPYEYQEFLLEPNVSINVCGGRANVALFYDYYYRASAERYGEDVYWQILSEDEIVLKTWNYSERDLHDLRFFKENSWNYVYNWEWAQSLSWTFTILPEDIESTK